MIALVHGLDPWRDTRLARNRIRAATMAVEGPLHEVVDLGLLVHAGQRRVSVVPDLVVAVV